MILAVGATLLAIRVAGDDDATSLLANYGAAAKRAGTYRFSTTQRVSGAQAGMGAFNMDGAVDLDRGLSRITMKISVLGKHTTCTYVGDDETLFVSVHPSRRAQLGAAWLRTSAETAIANVSLPFRPDRFDDDPGRFFKNLEESGNATIRGVETTRYRGRFDLQSVLPQQSAAPVASRFAEGLPAEIYLDDDGLMRRMEIDLSGGGSVDVLMRMDLFDYSKPVDIELPSGPQIKQGTASTVPTACFPVTIGTDR